MALEFPDHPFWDFSLGVYGQAGVPEACLVLQSAHHLDVNIMLYCLWFGASGRGWFDAVDMTQITGSVAQWHQEIVRPLRAVRQRLKDGMKPAPEDLTEPLRAGVQKLEIDFEHLEQLMLAGAIERAPDDAANGESRIRAALANMGRYFDFLDIRQSGEDRRSLAIILKAAFGDFDAEPVAKISGGLTAA